MYILLLLLERNGVCESFGLAGPKSEVVVTVSIDDIHTIYIYVYIYIYIYIYDDYDYVLYYTTTAVEVPKEEGVGRCCCWFVKCEISSL